MRQITSNGTLRKSYRFRSQVHNLIDDYKFPDNVEEWLPCPECGLRPKVWEFDNGRDAACGCHNSMYDHRSIAAESILSLVHRQNGSCLGYDRDALRNNWNHWCETGEDRFPKPKMYKEKGMW